MRIVLAVLFVMAAFCFARQNSPQDMKGMNMPGHDMSQPSAQKSVEDSDASGHVMQSMGGRHMNMGPHMKMTALRPPQPGDTQRAQKVVEVARAVMARYKDYHVALDHDFVIFHPEIPQMQYHFTNYGYALEARYDFNPEHPTSLLYEKDGDGYQLVGVMYTAPKSYSEDDLSQRIPLSVAQWHEHVNYCAPPEARKKEALGPNPKFGLRGSITTKEACDAAGGEFHPVIFNWMVHLYPLEKDPGEVWSVERQHAD